VTASAPTSLTFSWPPVAGSYVAALAYDSLFSNPISSGILTADPTTYLNLYSGMTYFFKVKIATNPDSGTAPRSAQ